MLGRVVSAVHPGSGSGAGSDTLATVTYDDHGRRSSLTYGNGTSASYDFDGAGRLHEIDWDLAGTGSDFSYDMSFTPASQLSSLTMSDASLQWAPPRARRRAH